MKKYIPVLLIVIAILAAGGIYFNLRQGSGQEAIESVKTFIEAYIRSPLSNPSESEIPEFLDPNLDYISSGRVMPTLTEGTYIRPPNEYEENMLSVIQAACSGPNETVQVDGHWFDCQAALGYPNQQPHIFDVTNEVNWNLMASDPSTQSITMGLTYDQWIAEGKPDPVSRCRQTDYPAGIQTSAEQYQDKQTGEIIGETLMCYELMGMSQEAWIQLKSGQ